MTSADMLLLIVDEDRDRDRLSELLTPRFASSACKVDVRIEDR